MTREKIIFQRLQSPTKPQGVQQQLPAAKKSNNVGKVAEMAKAIKRTFQKLSALTTTKKATIPRTP